jgi:NIPSNAP
MIVEERIYSIETGKMAELIRLYEAEGMAVQKKVLGHMVGYFSTDIGPLNLLVHMWGYKDLNDRARRRARLFKNKQWLSYVAKVQPLIKTQESRILMPTHFSPIR